MFWQRSEIVPKTQPERSYDVRSYKKMVYWVDEDPGWNDSWSSIRKSSCLKNSLISEEWLKSLTTYHNTCAEHGTVQTKS